jgi:ATP-dependent HslUV protease subunit HslV
LIITGNGDVLEPENGIVTIGSGAPMPQLPPLRAEQHTELSAQEIVKNHWNAWVSYASIPT